MEGIFPAEIMGIGAISGVGSGAVQGLFQKISSGQNVQKSDLQSVESAFGESSSGGGFINSLLNNFNQIDTNGDGISLQEMQSYMKASSSGHGKHGHGARGVTKNDLQTLETDIQSSGETVPNLVSDLTDAFDQVDSNGDGKIGVDEFAAYAKTQGWQFPQSSSGATLANADTASAAPNINNVLSTAAATQLQTGSSSATLRQLISTYGQYGLNTATDLAGTLLKNLAI